MHAPDRIEPVWYPQPVLVREALAREFSERRLPDWMEVCWAIMTVAGVMGSFGLVYRAAVSSWWLLALLPAAALMPVLIVGFGLPAVIKRRYVAQSCVLPQVAWRSVEGPAAPRFRTLLALAKLPTKRDPLAGPIIASWRELIDEMDEVRELEQLMCERGDTGVLATRAHNAKIELLDRRITAIEEERDRAAAAARRTEERRQSAQRRVAEREARNRAELLVNRFESELEVDDVSAELPAEVSPSPNVMPS